MKLLECLDEQDVVAEGDERYVAMAAYKANALKVRDELDKLELNLQHHRARYLKTDRTNWGHAGDLERVTSALADINDWLGNH